MYIYRYILYIYTISIYVINIIDMIDVKNIIIYIYIYI